MNVAWSARKVAADAAAVCYLFEWIFDAVFMKIFETRGSLLTDPFVTFITLTLYCNHKCKCITMTILQATILLMAYMITVSNPQPFQIQANPVEMLETISGNPTTPVFRLPWLFDVERLREDYLSATKDFDWNKNLSSGHSMPLLSESQVTPKVNFPLPFHVPTPPDGFLKACCPYFSAIYDYFNARTDVVTMRLLKRNPLTAYALHSDDDLDSAAENVRRFQIPLLNQDLSGLLLTLPHNSLLPVVAQRGVEYVSSNPLLNMEYHYPRNGQHTIPKWYGSNYTDEMLALMRHVDNFAELGAVYKMTTGYMHNFDTRTKHTVVNLSPNDRVTLAIDLVVNEEFTRTGVATSEIFGKHGIMLGQHERQRKNKVMLEAALQLHANMLHLGKIVLEVSLAGSQEESRVVVETKVSFESVEEYDAYKTLCGKTVNADEMQVPDDNCRIELIYQNDIVATLQKVETIEIDLSAVQNGEECRLAARVIFQDKKLVMESEPVVFTKK